MTPYTITTREGLLQELEAVRQQGYALDNEECELGMRCAAAPVRDYTGQVDGLRQRQRPCRPAHRRGHPQENPQPDGDCPAGLRRAVVPGKMSKRLSIGLYIKMRDHLLK